jgi:hypothetical protein
MTFLHLGAFKSDFEKLASFDVDELLNRSPVCVDTYFSCARASNGGVPSAWLSPWLINTDSFD